MLLSEGLGGEKKRLWGRKTVGGDCLKGCRWLRRRGSRESWGLFVGVTGDVIGALV